MRKASLGRSQVAALLVVALASLAGTSEDLSAQAKRCATAMLTLASRDAVECMHPRLVALMGGLAAARAGIERQRAAMASEGFSIESISIGKPGPPVRVGSREFALLPQTLRIRIPGGTLRQSSYLLAIREDGANRWHFLDGAGASPSALSQLFPDTPETEFEAKVQIPPTIRLLEEPY